jgi:hypothetical protein
LCSFEHYDRRWLVLLPEVIERQYFRRLLDLKDFKFYGSKKNSQEAIQMNAGVTVSIKGTSIGEFIPSNAL